MGGPWIFFLAVCFSLSAPALSVNRGVKLFKCCPKGHTFKDATLSKCVKAKSSWSYNWPAKEDKEGKLHFGIVDEVEGRSVTFDASQYLHYQAGKVSRNKLKTIFQQHNLEEL